MHPISIIGKIMFAISSISVVRSICQRRGYKRMDFSGCCSETEVSKQLYYVRYAGGLRYGYAGGGWITYLYGGCGASC
jgi:hypothetical protein